MTDSSHTPTADGQAPAEDVASPEQVDTAIEEAVGEGGVAEGMETGHDDFDTISEMFDDFEDEAADDPELAKEMGLPAHFGDDQAWTHGYPYDTKMSRKEYEREKRRLQVELLKMQAWVKETGQKIIIIFEGRDAAGKGGSIKRFTEHLNPRGARTVALATPTEREKSQWYFQRYVQHLPAGGEIVFMDRSWYNRAGVERVMGFCTGPQYLEFMRSCPEFERMLVNSGTILVKLWFSVGRDEQMHRFHRRSKDPVRQWKLSPTDLASLDKWDAYTRAKEAMFFYTDTADAPWTVIKSNDKKRARLEAMRHVLSVLDYPSKNTDIVDTVDHKIVGRGAEIFDDGEIPNR